MSISFVKAKRTNTLTNYFFPTYFKSSWYDLWSEWKWFSREIRFLRKTTTNIIMRIMQLDQREHKIYRNKFPTL